MAALGQREAEILSDVIEHYLASGTPVGSRAVAERHREGLSPATIRNVFSDLEEAGFLEQPHTSAGRLPTAKAIRWWLQQIQQPVVGRPVDTSALAQALLAATDDQAAWTLASRFLSDVSHHLGIVAVHPWRDSGLRHIGFVRLTDRRVLAVLVATDGQVRERVSLVPESYSQSELDQAARFFSRNFAGWTLAQIRRELVHRVGEERAAYDLLLERALVLYHCGLLEMQDSGQVFVQGAGHLVAELGAAQLSALLERIQQKERWLRLLDPAADAVDADEVVALSTDAPGPNGPQPPIRVQVGLEREEMPDLSLIAVECPLRDREHGALAILGPTRMEYRQAFSALAQVRDLLAGFIRQN